MKVTKLEKKILKIIANHSIYTIVEIERGYKVTKSIDILIEAIEGAPKQNISLDMAIMSSPIRRHHVRKPNVPRPQGDKRNIPE